MIPTAKGCMHYVQVSRATSAVLVDHPELHLKPLVSLNSLDMSVIYSCDFMPSVWPAII